MTSDDPAPPRPPVLARRRGTPLAPGRLGGALLVSAWLLALAVVPSWRLAGGLLLALCWMVVVLVRRPSSTLALALGAGVPLALSLAWPWVLGADAPVGAACVDPLEPIAWRRVTVLVAVGLAAWAAAHVHAVPAAWLALRWPGRRQPALSMGGGALVAVGGLVVGPALAQPFFGQVVFDRPVGAILPALVFAIANGTLEELAYRGVLQGILTRLAGPIVGLVVPAAVFGIVHVGPDITSLAPVHAAILGAGGLVAGLIVRRTGSLAIPIGIHVGADVALYVGLACRTTGG